MCRQARPLPDLPLAFPQGLTRHPTTRHSLPVHRLPNLIEPRSRPAIGPDDLDSPLVSSIAHSMPPHSSFFILHSPFPIPHSSFPMHHLSFLPPLLPPLPPGDLAFTTPSSGAPVASASSAALRPPHRVGAVHTRLRLAGAGCLPPCFFSKFPLIFHRHIPRPHITNLPGRQCLSHSHSAHSAHSAHPLPSGLLCASPGQRLSMPLQRAKTSLPHRHSSEPEGLKDECYWGFTVSPFHLFAPVAMM
jgi:hypothetical protein